MGISGSNTTGAVEVNAVSGVVKVSGAVLSWVVVVRGSGRENCISVSTAIPMLVGVVESGKKLKPTLNVSVVLNNLGDVLSGFAVGEDTELARPLEAAKEVDV